MLISLSTSILGALFFFASGRLILALLPPGWPGWAPGMGTRELGPTIGASWFLGFGALHGARGASFLVTSGLGLDARFDQSPTFAWSYVALHVALLALLLLRAPAKLRPRHETPPVPAPTWVRFLAAAVVIAACFPAFEEAVSTSFHTPSGWAGSLERVSGVQQRLLLPALFLFLAGALSRLDLRASVSWPLSVVVIAVAALPTSPWILDDFRYSRWTMLWFGTALVLAVVHAHTADRRPRALAVLILATLATTTWLAPLALLTLACAGHMIPGRRPPRHAWVLVSGAAMLGVLYRWFSAERRVAENAPFFDGELHLGVWFPAADWTRIVPPIQDPIVLGTICLALLLTVLAPRVRPRNDRLVAGRSPAQRNALLVFLAACVPGVVAWMYVMGIELTDPSPRGDEVVWYPNTALLIHALSVPLLLIAGLLLLPGRRDRTTDGA